MTDKPAVVIGRNIRAEMVRRGIRQVDLAQTLGMLQSSLSARLSGRIAFDVNELHAVAEALGMPACELLSGSKPSAGTGVAS